MKKAYVVKLEEAIRIRTDRMNSLVKIIERNRANYSAMSLNQLNRAIRENVSFQKEIAKHREFLTKAKKERDSFYANPTKVA